MKLMTTVGGSLLVCVGLLGGCGSPGTGDVDSFVKELAAAECSWEFRCCTDGEIQQQEMGKFKDQATCEEFQRLALEDTMYAEGLAVRQSRIKVDHAKAEACVAAQMSRACNTPPGAMPPPPPSPGTIDPCTEVFSGATKVGDECEFANECKKGAHCVATGAAGQGVCVPFQEEAQICNTSSDCDPSVTNLYCAQQDFQCHLRSPAGGPCAYTIDPVSMTPTTPLLLECDDTTAELYCDPASTTCKTLPASGEPCLVQPLPPGVNSRCAAGLVCDDPSGTGTGGTCRGPGAVGDDCTRIPCASTLYCDRSITPNTCKGLPSLGEDCQASGFECAKPYYCSTAMAPYVCAQPAELDMPCSSSILCDTGLYCDTASVNETCQAQLPEGAACTTSRMCLSNFCNFTGIAGTCGASPLSVQCIGRM